jgi:hypothetical protein
MEPRHKTSGGDELPPIPAKRYFTIGEVSECGVKTRTGQEFNQLKPVSVGAIGVITAS